MAAYKDLDEKSGEVRWRYRFSYDGRRYGGSTPRGRNTKKVAESLERAHLEKLIGRQYTGKMPLIREFAVRFLEHQAARTKPLTQVQQRATINVHLVPAYGSVRLDGFGLRQIDELVTSWSTDGHGPKTINTRLGTIRRMLSLACEWDIIAKVPRIRFLKIAEESPRYLSDVECALLIAKALPQWRSMIVVALRTGLRIGELRGLQWGDIEIGSRRSVIQVRRTDPGRKTMDATTPKGNRERTVPLSVDAIAELEALRPAKVAATAFVWPMLLRRSGETRNRARSEKGCWHGIELAREAAGLPDVSWHTLRHTFASHLVMHGVPLRVIQKWLGHSSIVQTEMYAHLSPEFAHEAVNVLDYPLSQDPNYQHRAKQLPPGDED